MAEANRRNPQLSDTIQEHLDAFPLDLPGGAPDRVNDFDGSFALTDKGLKATIKSGELLTNATWWQSTLLAVAFYGLGLTIRTACMLGVIAATGPAGVLAKTACVSVAGFLGAFLFRLVSFIIDGKKLDVNAWFDILCVALAGALVGSGAWEGVVGPWVTNSGEAFMTRVGNWLTELGGAVAGRWAQFGAAATRAGEAIRAWAAEFPGALRNAVNRLPGGAGVNAAPAR